jgi:IclR family transcriptional regulator, KDG regulon repressor
MDSSSTKWKTASGTRAIDRCFAVLDAVAAQPTTARKLTEQLSLPRPTIARLLQALERQGYVVADELGVYKLGSRPVELAAIWQRQSGPALTAESHLRQLVERCGESAYLVVREGLETVWIAGVESSHAIRFSAPIGQRLSGLHAGGFHKTLLAYAPESVRQTVLAGPLQKLATNTIVDRELLAQDLEQIRRNGFGESHSEVDEGLWSICAPVRDAVGIVGGIGVGGPGLRATDNVLEGIRCAVVETAAELSKALGARDVAESHPDTSDAWSR